MSENTEIGEISAGIISSQEITGDAVDRLVELGGALVDPDEVTEDGPIAAVYRLPEGYKTEVINLEQFRAPLRPGPRRKTGVYHVTDVASFLAYFTKHAGPNPETWVGDSAITAVLDAHSTWETRWEDHRLVLQLRHSPEWQRWFGMSGKWQGQQAFAEFLEDCAADVLEPDAATMLEVAQSLQAHIKADFKSAYRTSDGQRAFRYEETTTAKAGSKGELEIPERLVLLLRVFLGQEPIQVTARFRYRLSDEGLRLGVVLDRVQETLEAAGDLVVDQLTDGTDRGIVLRGQPR